MEAQRILGNDWVKVAEYCNNGQNNKQCGLRFNLYLDPKLKSKKQGPWTPEEVRFRCYFGKYWCLNRLLLLCLD